MKPFIDECGIIHIAYMATATFLSKEVVTTSGRVYDKRTTVARKHVAGSAQIEDVFQEPLTKDLRLQLASSRRT